VAIQNIPDAQLQNKKFALELEARPLVMDTEITKSITLELRVFRTLDHLLAA
jgi:hypothetical protein